MSKSFDKRKEDERSEGYDTVQTNLPKERFQEAKQVLSPDQLGVTESSIPGSAAAQTTSDTAAKKLKSKMRIRPDVSVTLEDDKQVGGVPLAGSMQTRSAAGTSSHSPADDTSRIPYSGGKYRPDTRYGKKRSEDLFILDNTISEQVVPEVDDSLDLREAPEAKQGYNGRKQFKQTRAKKNFQTSLAGKLPQQLLNECSVDFQTTKKVVWTTGQVVAPTSGSIDPQADYPTSCMGSAIVNPMKKSNYKPTSLVITTANGKISGISIAEDVYKTTATPVARDQANLNWQVDANNVAKTMIKLQKELGRETTDKWSPLGYVVEQPYEINMLSHDIEATTGAIMATAYRAAVSCMAYQRNIAAKDGVNPQINGVKMILEGYAGSLGSAAAIENSSFDEMIWQKSEYRKGSAAAIIAMFDSLGKYRTKADLLGLQRSFSLHLSQCDNNLNPLHCKPEFIKALNKAHMYSTIDGGYNPLLPIYDTKTVKLINPLSLNVFLQDWKNPKDFLPADRADKYRDQTTGTKTPYMYTYEDVRNKYDTRIQHPVVEGLIRWLLRHEGAFVTTFGDNATINIPFEFNFQSPGLLQFLLCSASQDVLWERNIIFRDILFAGDQSTYIWDDLQGLDKLNPLYSSQMSLGKYDEPIRMGKLSSDSALREMWGEHVSPMHLEDDACEYMLPWYFNEVAFGNRAGGSYTANEDFFEEASACNMSIPSIRDGVRHEYLDLIKGMSEADVRLSLDRMVAIPRFDKEDTSDTRFTAVHSIETDSSTLNGRIKLSTLRYDNNSDGRVIMQCDLVTGEDRQFTHHVIYLTPRELGYICDDVDGDVVITRALYDSNANKVALTTTSLSPDTAQHGGDCLAYNGYTPLRLTSYRVFANSPDDGSIDRSAALTQVFYRFFGSVNADTTAINKLYIGRTGIIPAMSYEDGAAGSVTAVLQLGGSTVSTHANDTTIRTFARRIWTMLQRFFLPVNRFENAFAVSASVNHDYDPLEFAVYFGFCGMLASDYTQHVNERLDAFDQLGLDYTEDMFTKESLIFRE